MYEKELELMESIVPCMVNIVTAYKRGKMTAQEAYRLMMVVPNAAYAQQLVYDRQ